METQSLLCVCVCVCVTVIHCNSVKYSILNKHAHTPHILDNNTYKGHTHTLTVH